MRPFKLDAMHVQILGHIAEGSTQKQISTALKLSKQAISQRLKSLEARKYIRRGVRDRIQVWKLTERGKGVVEGANRNFSVGQAKIDIFRHYLDPLGDKPPSIDVKLHQKRANGFKLYFKPYPTEYPKLEAMLAEHGLAYSRSAIHGSNQFVCDWQGYRFIFTTQKLMVYCPSKLYPFQLDGKLIVNEELLKANEAVTGFIQKLGIRLVEEHGKYWVRLAHLEIAHTQNEIAEELTAHRKGLIPLAFDPTTLKIVAWADRSLNLNELEFSDIYLERQVSRMMQAIKERKYDPLGEQEKTRLLIELAKKHSSDIDRILTLLPTYQQQINGLSSMIVGQGARNRREWT